MINSIESDRLQRLIDRKEASYKKMKEEDPNNPALKYLNSEITFLRDEILPIILCDTVTDYVEIRNFVTNCFRKLERRPVAAKNATDILIHFHLKDNPTLVPKGGNEPIPMAAYFSNMRHEQQFTTELYVNNKKVFPYPL
jgi:hypothetical protein